MRSGGTVRCVGGLVLLLGLAGLLGLRADGGGKEQGGKDKGDKEDYPNPIYKHWSAFKAGATVTCREKIKFPANSTEGQMYPDSTLVKDTTIKLLEVSPKKVVVQMIEIEHGRGYLREAAPIKLIYFAHIKKGLGTPKEGFDKHKEENVEIKVRGQTYKTTLVETHHKSGGVMRTQKIWLTDDVPGGIVKDIKTQRTVKGDELITESSLEIVSFAAVKATKAP